LFITCYQVFAPHQAGHATAYYALNSVVTLVAEGGQTRSKSFGGGTARMNGASLGGIIFF